MDFAILKNTKITERLSAQFRAEFFNIANRTDFGLPNAGLYGGSNGAGGGTPATLPPGFIGNTIPNSQREIQFGIKLLF